jgi:hypothetical protein
MALAGPVGEVVPIWLIFLLVGLALPLLAVLALTFGGMLRDEVDHPLDRKLEPAEPAST